MSSSDGRPLRVVRLIARLNVGGPSIQAITLSNLLTKRGYETVLVRGREGPLEGSMEYLARQYAVKPLDLPELRREPGIEDFKVVRKLLALFRDFRPDILHTHAAKAGTVGRVAAMFAPVGRPRVTVHTFHGHSLEGYFSRFSANLFLLIERFLARRTTQLVAVSSEVREDLVRLGVAPADDIRVIPLGLPLEHFVMDDDERRRRRTELREELGVPDDARVVTLIARLVPIKRVDRFLAAAAEVADRTDAWFVILGDGELRERLRTHVLSQKLKERLVWAGFRRDVAGACVASDVVVLTSDNEGTPVSLIESQAAGVPVVTTRVGGAESVVLDGETGYVVEPDGVDLLADAIESLLSDPEKAARMGAAGQRHVLERFGLERLVSDVDALYRELLEA